MFKNINETLARKFLAALPADLVSDAVGSIITSMSKPDLERTLGKLLSEDTKPAAIPTDIPHLGHTLNMAEAWACFQGKPIEAVKLVRERTGIGLKEAKGLVLAQQTLNCKLLGLSITPRHEPTGLTMERLEK